MSEPALVEAEQSLGFLLLKKEYLDEAQKHYDRAGQLDPKDALNLYGQGLVAIAKRQGRSHNWALDPLEKSVALNPDFAPARGIAWR